MTGSPAIDSANSSAPYHPALDIENHIRYDDPLTVNTGAGTRAYDDRGAYEFQEGQSTYTLTISRIGTGTGTVTSSPAGINCGPSTTLCSKEFSFSTVVTLTATATPGGYNRLKGWSGKGITCPVTGTCAVTITGNRLVYAEFEKTTFSDVPFTYGETLGGQFYPLYSYIEALNDYGFDNGCPNLPGAFCPGEILKRYEAAKLFVIARLGPDRATLPAEPYVFMDDFTGIEWSRPWAERMWDLGLSNGCQVSPRLFCPNLELKRVEGAKLGLIIEHGPGMPVPVGTGTVFADEIFKDPSYWGTGWAELAYAEGLLPACGTSGGKPLFCPETPLSRGWSAYIIIKARNLQPVE